MQLASFPAIWLLFYMRQMLEEEWGIKKGSMCVYSISYVYQQVSGISIQALGKKWKILHSQ